jgi:hypothetical protein
MVHLEQCQFCANGAFGLSVLGPRWPPYKGLTPYLFLDYCAQFKFIDAAKGEDACSPPPIIAHSPSKKNLSENDQAELYRHFPHYDPCCDHRPFSRLYRINRNAVCPTAEAPPVHPFWPYGINHRRLQIEMPQQHLNRSNIGLAVSFQAL